MEAEKGALSPSTFLPMAPCQESLFPLLLCLRFGGLPAIQEEGPFSSSSFFWEGKYGVSTDQPSLNSLLLGHSASPEDYYLWLSLSDPSFVLRREKSSKGIDPREGKIKCVVDL